MTAASECVAIYVRHGDKYKEMALLDWSQYLAHAEMMVRKSFSDNQTTVRLKRCAFLSTEDPAVVAEAEAAITRRVGG